MDAIEKYLNHPHKVVYFDEIDSTNTHAKNLARSGELSGTVIIAGSQTAGRGRLGRSFCSPEGTSIYMSIILRPDADIETAGRLTACTAVAAALAADKVCGIDTKIKWVNDLYLNGKKFCGILTESEVNSSGSLDFAVIGIGMNINSVKNAFEPELLEIATSVEDETGIRFSREVIAAEIINELDRLLPGLGKNTFIEEYRRRSCILGYDVAVTVNSEGKIARAVGIADNGGLIVEYPDGKRNTVTSGEARIILPHRKNK
ncbi:MAG: biotin--[acetyl-CoA-carboxylase] ligase [Porcipelethomonas sp.]